MKVEEKTEDKLKHEEPRPHVKRKLYFDALPEAVGSAAEEDEVAEYSPSRIQYNKISGPMCVGRWRQLACHRRNGYPEIVAVNKRKRKDG